jgi:hypothetical protein
VYRSCHPNHFDPERCLWEKSLLHWQLRVKLIIKLKILIVIRSNVTSLSQFDIKYGVRNRQITAETTRIKNLAFIGLIFAAELAQEMHAVIQLNIFIVG